MKAPSEIARDNMRSAIWLCPRAEKHGDVTCPECLPIFQAINEAVKQAITAERQRQEEITKAFSKSDLHNFYQWEIDKHSVEYEVEFRGIEIKELREKQERLEDEIKTLKRHWIEDDRDLNDLIAQNEKLVEALQMIKERCCSVNYSDYKARLESGIKASEALQVLKEVK